MLRLETDVFGRLEVGEIVGSRDLAAGEMESDQGKERRNEMEARLARETGRV